MFGNKLHNRKEAGILLSEKLNKYQDTNAVVLAIPRGGVPIGYEIAKRLNLQLDVILSKKIGHPHNKEYAIGAVSLDSTIIDDHPEISKEYINDEITRLRKLLKINYELFRGNRKPIDVSGKNIILVDDGIATGNTLKACIQMLRKKNPLKIIVAVPVLPSDALEKFQQLSDEFIYLVDSHNFGAVGAFYEDFSQVEDEEVIQILNI